MKRSTIIIKNGLILLMFIISAIPSLYFGTTEHERWLSIVHTSEYPMYLDWWYIVYGNAVNFAILAYMLYRPKGVDDRVKKLVWLMACFDLIHLVVLGMKYFGVVKLALAIGLVFGNYAWRKKRANANG